MALDFGAKASSGKVDFGRVEDGAYPARIVQILDFGMQIETDWKTGENKTYEDSGALVIKHKVWINFELPTETIEVNGETKPRWYGKEYTVSAHEKSALYALLKAVDPKGEATNKGRNVKGLLGLPAMVTIASTSSGKAKIGSVSGVPKGMQVDSLVNDEGFFDLDSQDVEAFAKIPNWMQTRIKDGVDFDKTKFSKVVDGVPQKAAESVSTSDY